MKNWKAFTVVLASIFIVVACNDEKVTNAPDETLTESEQEQANTAEEMARAPFNFTSFDLDVDYGTNSHFEVEYENEASRIESKIVNQSNEETVGNDAYTQLSPIFTSFTFDSETADTEVINEVLRAFNLEDTYQEFDLDIRYGNGVEKEYKMQK